MKHYVKPECKHGCRFLQVSDDLWLCPHAAYGATSYKKGAIAEARALLEKAGGYQAVLERLEKKEDETRAAARKKKEEKDRALVQSMKFE